MITRLQTEPLCAGEMAKACIAELSVTELVLGSALALAILVALLLLVLPRLRRSAILAKTDPKAEI
jgi:nitrate reductase gamma subunit